MAGRWFFCLRSQNTWLYWMSFLLSYHLPAAVLLGSLCGSAFLLLHLCIQAQIQTRYSSVTGILLGIHLKDSTKALQIAECLWHEGTQLFLEQVQLPQKYKWNRPKCLTMYTKSVIHSVYQLFKWIDAPHTQK